MRNFEKDCKQCGKCCTPTINFRKRFVSSKHIRCKFLLEDNFCSVYNHRKIFKWCKRPFEIDWRYRKKDCEFGGGALELTDREEFELQEDPPIELIGALISGAFIWR